MVETNLGISVMEQLLTGATPTGSPPPAVPFSNAWARIAIGDGNGSVPTVAATDTALAAPTNIIYLTMSSTAYPQVSAAAPMVMTWQGTATGSQGNWAWREWGIDNGGGGNTPVTLFNHKAVALGTKSSGTTWTFQASITQT
jgi:hypothetical protein